MVFCYFFAFCLKKNTRLGKFYTMPWSCRNAWVKYKTLIFFKQKDDYINGSAASSYVGKDRKEMYKNDIK